MHLPTRRLVVPTTSTAGVSLSRFIRVVEVSPFIHTVILLVWASSPIFQVFMDVVVVLRRRVVDMSVPLYSATRVMCAASSPTGPSARRRLSQTTKTFSPVHERAPGQK